MACQHRQAPLILNMACLVDFILAMSIKSTVCRCEYFCMHIIACPSKQIPGPLTEISRTFQDQNHFQGLSSSWKFYKKSSIRCENPDESTRWMLFTTSILQYLLTMTWGHTVTVTKYVIRMHATTNITQRYYYRSNTLALVNFWTSK